MGPRDNASIRFTLNGRRLELTRDQVQTRLRDVLPEPVRKHAVRVNGTWFPVMQAFEVVTGIRRSEYISHTARRHLAALGFEVAGQIEPRGGAAAAASARSETRSLGRSTEPDERSVEEWHTEANVQAALVSALARDGWRILSVANTATREHGVDVIATLGDRTVGVEVKGYPSRTYADPARAGEVKRTAPSNQAGHWYAQAVLAAMRLRTKQPSWQSVVALPDFPRYRALYAETQTSLEAAAIAVWWMTETGEVLGS